jgi:hypothetical protein
MGSATEAKGFGASRWNNFYQDFSLNRIDKSIMIFCLVMTLVSFYVRFVLGLGLAEVGWTR